MYGVGATLICKIEKTQNVYLIFHNHKHRMDLKIFKPILLV